MKQGIEDYLETMQLAGVSELERVSSAVQNPPPQRERGQDRTGGLTSPALKEVSPAPKKMPSAPKEASPTLEVVPSVSADSSKLGQLQRLADEVKACTLCQELASTRKQTVFGTGNHDAELVFLGEAPGAEEDRQGEPFVGRAGQLLTDMITKGMKCRRGDVYICNILRCRPPENRNPLPEESAHCRRFLDQTLEIIKPKFICCLGAVAAKNLLQSEATIGALRGKVFEYKGIKVVCTYHPAYLLRNPSAKKSTWDDLQLLMREMAQAR